MASYVYFIVQKNYVDIIFMFCNCSSYSATKITCRQALSRKAEKWESKGRKKVSLNSHPLVQIFLSQPKTRWCVYGHTNVCPVF